MRLTWQFMENSGSRYFARERSLLASISWSISAALSPQCLQDSGALAHQFKIGLGLLIHLWAQRPWEWKTPEISSLPWFSQVSGTAIGRCYLWPIHESVLLERYFFPANPIGGADLLSARRFLLLWVQRILTFNILCLTGLLPSHFPPCSGATAGRAVEFRVASE